MSTHFDVIIIGSGPAGFSCAMQASKFGKSVMMVEASVRDIGGTWINTGTVPSKALREAAFNIYKYTQQFGHYEEKKPYLRFKMKDLLRLKNAVLEDENQKVKQNLIENEVKVIRGLGRVVDDKTVEVHDHFGNKSSYTADFILLASGSRPEKPEHIEIDHNTIRDSDSILELGHIPRRVVVFGAGVYAMEYVTVFAALGTQVTVLNPKPHYLPFLDDEIKSELNVSLKRMGVQMFHNVKLEQVSFNPLRNCTEVRYILMDKEELHVVETENVLYLSGRQANTDHLGLENVNITLDDKGFIPVNENYQSVVPSIYACGDVIGNPALASVSFTQGRLAACNMFGIPSREVASEIPFGIYTIPEISSIGLTEKEAIEQGYDVTVGRAKYSNLAKATVVSSENGLLKLVFETSTFKLLGVHVIGENASEIIHIGQAVIAYGGDIRYFISHVMNYPTFSEAYRKAAFNGVNRVFKAGKKYRSLLETETKA